MTALNNMFVHVQKADILAKLLDFLIKYLVVINSFMSNT